MASREGFISKLENSASTSANGAETDSLSSEQNHSEQESTFQEQEMSRNSVTPHLEDSPEGNEILQELEREVSEVENQVVNDVSNQEDVSSMNDGNVQEQSSYIDVNPQDSSNDVGSVHTIEGQISDDASSDQVFNVEETDNRSIEETNVTTSNELPLETEDLNFRSPVDLLHDHYESRSSVSFAEETAAHTTDLEGNMDEQYDRSFDSARVDELHYTITGEAMARNWEERSSGNEVYRETSQINAAEQDQMQETQEEWQGHDLQEAIDSWLGMPSPEVGASVGRLDSFYYSDDENVHSIELQELFSRYAI